jgi:hypothetical protein
MFGRTQRDNRNSREQHSQALNDYRNQTLQNNVRPTLNEYEAVHGALPAMRGVRDWTALDIQYLPSHGSNVDFGNDDASEKTDIPYAFDEYEDGTGVALASNTVDPFQEAVAEHTENIREPLRKDRNSIEYIRSQHTRARMLANVFNDNEGGDDVLDASVDTEVLTRRTHMADILPPDAASHFFTARSDRRERMSAADARLKVTANSTLGKQSYGNYGI